MEERLLTKNSRRGGRKKVSRRREDPVVSVPPVRVRDGIGIDVPRVVAGVPVAVDCPELSCAASHP